MKHSTKVKAYYENNTSRFIWWHQDKGTKSIHQPLWKEASFTTKEAFFYSNHLILEAINTYSSKKALTIIDLGCGLGSTLFFLLARVQQPANYYGVTISPTQVSFAKNRVKQFFQDSKITAPIHFYEADFTALPTVIPSVDIAFSIEAFVHASDPEKYLEQISGKLIKGGKLILIDDFLNDSVYTYQLNTKGKKAIEDFQYGWLAPSLLRPTTLRKIAANYQLKVIEEVDLTPLMKNNTLKHKWIRFLVYSFRWLYDLLPWKSYYFRSWIGGKGKQYCLKHGIVRYMKIVLEAV